MPCSVSRRTRSERTRSKERAAATVDRMVRHAARIGVTGSPPGKVGQNRTRFRGSELGLEDCFRFASDSKSPFDNAAEEQIRMARLRSPAAACAFSSRLSVCSHLAATAKHFVDRLDVLKKLASDTTGS